MKPQRRQPMDEVRFVRTIEKTAKAYKGPMALGVLAILVGVVMWIAGVASDSPSNGVVVMIIGFIVYFAARIGAWWDHG